MLVHALRGMAVFSQLTVCFLYAVASMQCCANIMLYLLRTVLYDAPRHLVWKNFEGNFARQYLL